MSAHRTTRRAMLAGTATLSALAAAGSTAMAAPVDDDPVFAAIDAHRRAKRAWEKAVTAADLPGDTPSARIIVGFNKDGDFITERNEEDDAITVKWVPNGKEKPIYVGYPEEIEHHAPGHLRGLDRETWVADRTAELKKEEERVAAEYAQTERGRLRTIADAADDLDRDRAWDLIWTVPTTLASVAAFLAYIRKNGTLDELVEESEWINALEWTIGKGVCAIAGLPEPTMDKEVAALWDQAVVEVAS
jgi:hypothetical protein